MDFSTWPVLAWTSGVDLRCAQSPGDARERQWEGAFCPGCSASRHFNSIEVLGCALQGGPPLGTQSAVMGEEVDFMLKGFCAVDLFA